MKKLKHIIGTGLSKPWLVVFLLVLYPAFNVAFSKAVEAAGTTWLGTGQLVDQWIHGVSLPTTLGVMDGYSWSPITANRPTITAQRWDAGNAPDGATISPYLFLTHAYGAPTNAAIYSLASYASSAEARSHGPFDLVALTGSAIARNDSNARVRGIYGEAFDAAGNGQSYAVAAEFIVGNQTGKPAVPNPGFGHLLGVAVQGRGDAQSAYNTTGVWINGDGAYGAFRHGIQFGPDAIAPGGSGIDFSAAGRKAVVRLGPGGRIVGVASSGWDETLWEYDLDTFYLRVPNSGSLQITNGNRSWMHMMVTQEGNISFGPAYDWGGGTGVFVFAVPSAIPSRAPANGCIDYAFARNRWTWCEGRPTPVKLGYVD